jgi:hypothetical protein
MEYNFYDPETALQGMARLMTLKGEEHIHDWDKGRAWMYNPTLKILTPGDGVDLDEVDYLPARWGRFIKEYINLEELGIFLQSLKDLKAAQERVYTFATRANHEQGNCLIAATFDIHGVTLFSRSGILYPTAALDLNIGSLLVRELLRNCPRVTGIPMLTWHISMLQLHTNTFLPKLAKDDQLRGLIEAKILREPMNGYTQFLAIMMQEYDLATTADASKIKYKRTARMVNHVQRLRERNEPRYSYRPTLWP